MKLGERILNADDWLLEHIFQPAADRLPDQPSAFDVGLSLQIGAIVFLIAADFALFTVGRLGVAGAVWDGLSAACGLWFYRVIQNWRSSIQRGTANPLRPLYRPLRLLAIAYAAYSIAMVGAATPTGRLAAGFNAASNVAFVIGMYFISCEKRPPLARRATRLVASAASRLG